MPSPLEESLARLAAIDAAIQDFRHKGDDVAPLMAARQMLVAQVAVCRNEIAEAVTAYRGALEQFRAAKMERERATVATDAARRLEDAGHLEEAFSFADAALDSAEWIWGAAASIERLVAPTLLVDAADIGVRLAARLDDGARAFDVAQRAKSRWVLDALALREYQSLPLPTLLRSRAATNTEALTAAIAHLDAAWNAHFANASVPVLESAEQELLQAYAATAGARHPLQILRLAPASIDECRTALGDSEALLEWFVTTDRLVAVLVRRDTSELVTWDWPADQLRRDLMMAYLRLTQGESRRGFREQIASLPDVERRDALGAVAQVLYGDADAVAGQLGDRLLGPLTSRLDGVTRVVLCPHWALHVVPFAMLVDAAKSKSLLADRVALTHAPSASAWLRLRRMRNAAPIAAPQAGASAVPSDAAVFGIERRFAPPAPTWFSQPRPGVGSAVDPSIIEDEARVVARALGVPARTGVQASKTAVEHALLEDRIVHLSAHGELSRPHPLLDGVHLADGIFTVAEILTTSALDNAHPALVVLSACRSALDRVEPGDRPLGAGHGLLVRLGCRVLASLWPVDGEATALLMSRFFAHRAAGSDDADALRRAQLDVRAAHGQPTSSGTAISFADPYYWSGFLLLGD